MHPFVRTLSNPSRESRPSRMATGAASKRGESKSVRSLLWRRICFSLSCLRLLPPLFLDQTARSVEGWAGSRTRAFPSPLRRYWLSAPSGAARTKGRSGGGTRRRCPLPQASQRARRSGGASARAPPNFSFKLLSDERGASSERGEGREEERENRFKFRAAADFRNRIHYESVDTYLTAQQLPRHMERMNRA